MSHSSVFGVSMQRLYAALFLSMLSGSLRLPMSQGSMGVSGNISPSESGQAKDTVTGLCLPWPECATAWVDKAVRERETVGGSLAQLMQAIDKGKSQNCSQTSMCKPEKRIEEIDKILAGVQKLWEEQAIKVILCPRACACACMQTLARALQYVICIHACL